MVASVAGAVVGAVVGAVTKNVVAQVVKLVEKRCELWKGFPNDIEFIKRELLMIAGAEEDQISGNGAHQSVVKMVSMEEMRDLAHDIEDCLDRILRYTAEGEGEAPLLHRLKGPPFVTEVKQLKDRLKAAHQRKVDYNVNGNNNPGTSSTTSLVNTDTACWVEPVGIDQPKRELLELLLMKEVEDQQEHLNVISIVGFGGSGKSTLAKALYDCPDVVRQFPCRAWVVASEHRGNSKGFLTALLENLRPGGDPTMGGLHQLQYDIRNYLNTKRYLIVFDNIEEEQWDCVKSTFPEMTRSRIIVTTRTQAVAEVCCNHGNNGFVYNMRTLNEKHSMELLEVILKRHLPGLEQSSTVIVSKCDGHPLALVSVANYLLREKQFTETDCKNFWRHLGSHMEKEYAFTKLQQVLMSNYRSLPSRPVDLKTCLLYVCVFPNGHAIRRSSLMRRWLAEGYVRDSDPREALVVADKSLEELLDRNIIRQIDPSKNAKVKTCRAHGIMHEFILHMSMSAKFITSLRDPQRRNYRHLFMEGCPATSTSRVSNVNNRHTSPSNAGTSVNEKLRAHSLTILGRVGEAVVDFAKCELLRVLDLEECKDLEDHHMDGIHKLWHLKYLSLGGTISRLPRKIEKLHCLETLDMRKARIETLPVEVIKLPHLAHLLGKFKLGKRDLKMSELGKFLPPKESNLQTLAGFITDNNPGFPMLMLRMKKLRKVKIWCHDDDSKSLAELSTGIQKFVEHELDTSIGVRSLSLHLRHCSGNIIHSLGNSFGYLSSLKLHGALSGLTQFATSLCGLTELCLASTNDLISNDMTNLRRLMHLEYLKLVKISLGGFSIRKRDFPRLLRLCLAQCPTLPTIENGALRNLISLQLLSEHLGADLPGIEIRSHEHLQEIVLDSEINREAKIIWENAAKNHPKRPRVLYLRRVDPDEMGSMVKYVAAKTPAPDETVYSVMQEERQSSAAQPISDEELSSALKDADGAGPSMMPSSKFPSAMNNVMPSSSRVVS
ncbi:hypothetical protein C2845_PM03G29910 [Panicum miliaceum]|uniref:NB-ARC domain-containing protein n=1 Tax=Panicum miliaceum TaxID=4540 RepID=A0A3L6TDD6_PANMI|nr:hypothetical protein C2845_PM03G29910 [Panicum miliaceum]